jgi:hypothetical protein
MDFSILTQIGGTVGMNGLLWGLRKITPKIPAATIPAINIGLTTMLAIYAPWLLTPMDAAIISGGSTIIHNTVKNLMKGDQFGQGSTPNPEERK